MFFLCPLEKILNVFISFESVFSESLTAFADDITQSFLFVADVFYIFCSIHTAFQLWQIVQTVLCKCNILNCACNVV